MARMKDYKPNFINGKPTDDFKRRSSMYDFVVRPDGTTAWKLRSPADQALARLKQSCKKTFLKKT